MKAIYSLQFSSKAIIGHPQLIIQQISCRVSLSASSLHHSSCYIHLRIGQMKDDIVVLNKFANWRLNKPLLHWQRREVLRVSVMIDAVDGNLAFCVKQEKTP